MKLKNYFLILTAIVVFAPLISNAGAGVGDPGGAPVFDGYLPASQGEAMLIISGPDFKSREVYPDGTVLQIALGETLPGSLSNGRYKFEYRSLTENGPHGIISTGHFRVTNGSILLK